MSLADLDLRWLTASCFVAIGAIFIWFALRVWRTHPINRVFSLGPFVTEEGLRLLLSSVGTLFSIGLWLLSAGVARFSYWLRWNHHLASEIANFLGIIEAVFSLWAAGCVIIAAWRLCRKG